MESKKIFLVNIRPKVHPFTTSNKFGDFLIPLPPLLHLMTRFTEAFIHSKLRRLGFLNRIIDNSNSKPSKFDGDYETNLITRRRSSRPLRFQSNFDLFLIKVPGFWSIFNLKIDLSRLKDWKYQLKDQKFWFISKRWFILTPFLI